MTGDSLSIPGEDGLPALSRELQASFRGWSAAEAEESEHSAWDDERFDELALRAFRLQHRGNRAYRRYCDRRGENPSAVSSWRDVPPVPTAGFRAVPLVVGDPAAAALEFRTSGTTGRLERRGRHLVRDPALYRASLEASFRALVLPRCSSTREERRMPRMLSLVPPFREAPHSSLSWMVDAVMERFSSGGGTHAAAESGIRWERATSAAEAAAEAGEPLLVLTTTLAAAEWMGHLRRARREMALPDGSLLMDTGGAKGQPELSREAMVSGVQEWLGIPAGRVVNEFGMTELLSQRYSVPPAGGPAGVGHGGRDQRETPWLEAPPWLRTRCLDPESLAELPDGDVGLLCHFDLANAGSVCAVLTEDLGRVQEGLVQYLGRVEGSPPRGCSLATAELLDAQEEGLATDWSVGTPDPAPPGTSEA